MNYAPIFNEVRSQKSEVRSCFCKGDLSNPPKKFRLKRQRRGFRPNYFDKIYLILIAVPLSGLWVLDTAALLPFHDNENNGRLGKIPWKIFSPKIASAQTSTPPIVAEENSTNTVVTPVTPSPDSSTTRFDITGGKQSQDNTNLFHSFERFNVGENQIVNFISNPNIKNILTRVTGGDASVINGLIQVTGGNSNLLIMNSAGIIFGANARLDVPASFVVTTGSGIGFDSGWFNSIGENNYDILTGSPSAFSFPMTNPGVILNEGELTVEAGESVTLLGGTIINTGKISAPGGEITISTVPGENLVRISQEGRLLNLEIATEDGESSNDLPEELNSLNPLSIPELLTGNSEVMEIATGVRVNDNNEVVLTGSNQVIPTDLGTTIVSGSLDISFAENSELANTSRINIFGEKVGLFNAKLNASGLYGSGNIRIGGDSQGLGTVPRATRTYVDENTEIFATSVRGEGGNIVIWSDEETSFFGKIEAIGRIEEQSISAEQNSSKNLVEVSSQGNLIFDGSVNLGSPDLLGSLSFKAENINIVDGNIEVADNPLRGERLTESQISKSSIENISDSTNITFQASDNITVNNLSETQLSFAQTKGEISFVADSDENGLGSLTIDSENTINTQGAAVNISGTTINTGDINTAGGELNITSTEGFVMTNNLSTANSNTTVESNGGEINITAQGDITTGEIDASGDSRGGNITMNAATNIDTESIHAEGKQSGGNINIKA
ncbi:MAG: filamentous hemagglutinin N-terminal domain-containing protein, partial [Okeania sp. SIO3C4]|nr:filamentous hemagglutinin N-terminal domain-containing protein [Okeania sp. SIO3C4]